MNDKMIARRWMIEIPTTPTLFIKESRKIKRINTLPYIVKPFDSEAVVENIHEIVVELQKICSLMNSYFGKKVKIDGISFCNL